MVIVSKDRQRAVYVGGSDALYSLYSTIVIRLSHCKDEISKALAFFENGVCQNSDGYETARQFNLIRDELSKVPPEQAVYDCNDLSREAPWKGNISPVITSCANLYTTSDGKDLLYEIVSILCYAQIKKTDVQIVM